MSYKALYRKWRPLQFEDVVEQQHVVQTLKHAVKSDRIAHAYLFSGTRGTGKTTIARIFARAINCQSPVDGNPCNECEACKGILNETITDVIEIDAASNNGVDNIREIRDEVMYAPTQTKYKVYIIDEVHMLSTGAFNALLKTLEEPPDRVVFILATTDPQKLPATVLSRCQRFEFRRISVESIMDRLFFIAEQSGKKLQPEAAKLISIVSEGALRDAISILDQCFALGREEISYDDVSKVIGLVNDQFLSEVVDTLLKRDVYNVIEKITQLVYEGRNLSKFVNDLVMYYRNLLICKVTDQPEKIIEASEEILKILQIQAKSLTKEGISDIIKELSQLENNMKWASQPRVLLEVALIKICQETVIDSSENLLERIKQLELKLQNGNFHALMPSNNENNTNIEKIKKEKKKINTNKKKFEKFEGQKAVMDEIKSTGRIGLFTLLLETVIVHLDKDTLGLIAANNFMRDELSKYENTSYIQEVIKKLFDLDMKIKVFTEQELENFVPSKTKEEIPEGMKKFEERMRVNNVPFDIIEE